MKILSIAASVMAALIAVGWLGLRIKPAPFPAWAQRPPQLETIPLPAGLPAPVERFYRVTYGDRVPVIQTAVLSGRGALRLFGLAVPIRFRFTHEAGRNYRHDIDLTWFGLPLMQAYETLIDGRGYAITPGGLDEGEGFDQGSNVSLWAEALNWFPAILVTDPRVQWAAVDDATALLAVPFGDKQEILVVRFNPADGRAQHIEAMKYKSAAGVKMLWISGVWLDEGAPWIRLDVQEALYNVDVRDYIRAAR